MSATVSRTQAAVQVRHGVCQIIGVSVYTDRVRRWDCVRIITTSEDIQTWL